MNGNGERTYDKKLLLRYQVVSAVKGLMLAGKKRSAAITAVAEHLHPDDEGNTHQFSRRTVQRWLKALETEGIEGLRDQPRKRCQSSQVLKPALLDFVKLQKKKDEHASVPELIRRAREAGVLHPLEAVDRTTLWRAMRRMGVATRPKRGVQVDDKRRFSFTERMRMVLVDFKHFRAGPTRARRVAIYFLDDATRFGLAVLVGTEGEKTIYCLRCLLEVLRRHGLMDAVYMDNGPGFIADDFKGVLRKLEVLDIYGTAGYPQGHGKIERFNRSLKARVLRNYDGADWVDPDPLSLTARLRHDLFEVYNHLPHQSLDNDTPSQRWMASSRPLKPVESDDELKAAFIIRENRKVSNDHCIPFRGTYYEVPVGLAGRPIEIERALLEDDALYLDHEGRRIRLHPVDPVFNATSGRARGIESVEEPAACPVKSASSLSFDSEYGSLLDPDGGFPERDDAESLTTNNKED